MLDKKVVTHSFKKDKYASARGGNSNFLDIYCSKCNDHIFLYQKDGRGRLLRAYLDRIIEPEELSHLELKFHNTQEMSNLKCSKCNVIIGVPMVYTRENRLAYRLIHGTFIKRKSDGVYPPKPL